MRRTLWNVLCGLTCLAPVVSCLGARDTALEAARLGEERLQQVAQHAAEDALADAGDCWRAIHLSFLHDGTVRGGCCYQHERQALFMLACHLRQSMRLGEASEALQGVLAHLPRAGRLAAAGNRSAAATAWPPLEVAAVTRSLTTDEFQLYSLFFAHCTSICYFLLSRTHAARVEDAVIQMQQHAAAAIQAMQRALRQPPNCRSPWALPLVSTLVAPLFLLLLLLGGAVPRGRPLLWILPLLYASGGWVALDGLPVPVLLLRGLSYCKSLTASALP